MKLILTIRVPFCSISSITWPEFRADILMYKSLSVYKEHGMIETKYTQSGIVFSLPPFSMHVTIRKRGIVLWYSQLSVFAYKLTLTNPGSKLSFIFHLPTLISSLPPAAHSHVWLIAMCKNPITNRNFHVVPSPYASLHSRWRSASVREACDTWLSLGGWANLLWYVDIHSVLCRTQR